MTSLALQVYGVEKDVESLKELKAAVSDDLWAIDLSLGWLAGAENPRFREPTLDANTQIIEWADTLMDSGTTYEEMREAASALCAVCDGFVSWARQAGLADVETQARDNHARALKVQKRVNQFTA